MIIKKLFGNNIEPRCEYCFYLNSEKNSNAFCQKSHRAPKDEQCKRFKYDPLKRTPTILPSLPKYSREDFSL